MKIKHNTAILFSILLIFFIIRIINLNDVFLLHDERDIVLTGYSISKTGKDLFGNFFPLTFENISPSNPIFAIYYSALWHLIFPKSIFFARLAYIFISSFLIFLIYILILKITDDKKISFLTSIVLCFSPWIFHISRLALEISLALILIILAIIFYLDKKRLVAYLLFFITSFTYQGYKILIPFLLFYLEFFFLIRRKSSNKNFIRQNIYNLIFIIFLIFSTLAIDKNIASNRKNELIFFNQQKLKQVVDFKRATSKAPLSISGFFDNKLTTVINHLTSNIFKSFNPLYLFKTGDPSAINGNTAGGQFFTLLIIFYFLGFLSLGKNGKKEDFFTLGFVFIGIFPAIIKIDDDPSISIRGSLSIIGFSYLIALGVIYYFNLIKNKPFKNYLNIFLLFLILMNIVSFSYNYFFRRPILIAEIYNENERKLVSYLNENNKKTINIYTNNPKDLYFSLIFLKAKDKEIDFFQKNLKKGLPYYWHNYIFNQCQNDYDYLKEKNNIIFEGCLNEKEYQKYQEKVVKKIPYSDFYSAKTAYFIND